MAIQDDAKNFLLSALSRAGGDLPSLQLEWLATQGYTRGTIDDRWQAYLAANAYYLPEGLSRLLVGLNRAIGNNWTPNLLFQSGDILLWYDPSDLSTMFTNTTGTTQVAADGDSVALMLDKGQWGGKTLSQVLAAQTELVSNGTFDSDTTGWTATNSTLAAVSGELEVTGSGGAYPSGSISITCVVGRTYRITVTARRGTTASSASWVVQTTAPSNITTPVNNGLTNTTTSVYFTATATTHLVTCYINSLTGSGTAYFDNVSVKEIPGYHRVQATGTSMPKYKTGPNPAAAENSPELLTNTGFDSDTVWVKGVVGSPTAATISAGVANLPRTNSTNYAYVSQSFATEIGASYRLVVTSVSGSYAARAGTIANATQSLNALGAAGGTTTFVFTATATTTHVTLIPGTDGVTSVIDAASTKLIPASAPYIHWLLYDGTDDGHATGTVPFNTVTSDGAARRNLLTEPDKFDHSTWTKENVTVTANTVAAPDGATTADKLAETTATDVHRAYQAYTFTGVQTHTFSCYLKAGERSWAILTMGTAAFSGDKSAYFDLANGVVGTVASGTTANITSVGDGWYRCAITANSISGALTASYRIGVAQADNTASYAGTTGHGIYTWGAQLDVGSTATDFQNIGTDEVAVCAGVTKSSDAAAGIVIELSAASTNNRAFALIAPTASATPDVFFRAGGTLTPAQFISSLPAPVTRIFTGLAKISTDSHKVRVNGAQTTIADDQGTGNFGDHVLNFGRRNNTSTPFNGREYQTVIRSRLLSAAELSSLETFVAAKTGVIL